MFSHSHQAQSSSHAEWFWNFPVWVILFIITHFIRHLVNITWMLTHEILIISMDQSILETKIVGNKLLDFFITGKNKFVFLIVEKMCLDLTFVRTKLPLFSQPWKIPQLLPRDFCWEVYCNQYLSPEKIRYFSSLFWFCFVLVLRVFFSK